MKLTWTTDNFELPPGSTCYMYCKQGTLYFVVFYDTTNMYLNVKVVLLSFSFIEIVNKKIE